MERRDANDGIMPDNIGPGGGIDELMDGKWWGDTTAGAGRTGPAPSLNPLLSLAAALR